MTARIGIVGAGMAGLSCARALADAGRTVTVLDKSRGLGGRLATRRAENGLQFDHGAQYVTARERGFQDLLASAGAAGAAASWSMGERTGFVGVPAMNGLAKHLAGGLQIRRSFQVDEIQQHGGGWAVSSQDEVLDFDILILTAPAPQSEALLGTKHPLARKIRHVKMLPCWTLMAALVEPATVSFRAQRTPDAPLAWIALDSSKPGRTSRSCWVAQAGPEWSAQHLEDEKTVVRENLLSLLCDALGRSPEDALHSDVHRWRYARVDVAYGSAFLKDETDSLYLGGDWCLGARVEAAWQSGTAIARDLLELQTC